MTNKKPTVALNMIVKDEVEKVTKLISGAQGYFDQINLTVSDKTAANKLSKLLPPNHVNIKWREWTDDFAAARNANLAQCTTDFFFWLDADDQFDFRAIPELVKLAEEGPFDAIYLPYNYAQDENGRCVALHWRERLIRRSVGFEWRGVIHESLLVDTPFRGHRLEGPEIFHASPDKDNSIERNHRILEKAVIGVENPDPRNVHYLGVSFYTKGDFKNCIKWLSEYIKVGGWDEEIYRSLIKMSESANGLDDYEAAKGYALKAAGLMPEYPNAYYCLAQYEFIEQNWKECLEWLQVAFKKPIPETMSVVDPTMPDRARIMGASSEFQLGHYRDAEKILESADDPAKDELLPIFKLEASKERFIEIVPALTKHVNASKFWASLQEDLQYDRRLKWLREEATEPKKWPKNSIVFFCGQSYEEWGPHTVDEKGMGGSEEAILYLSRELAKLGMEVVVYGALEKQIFDTGFGKDSNTFVKWLPWRMFDTRDEFDTLVVWRSPHGIDKLKARVKIMDIHDKLEPRGLKDLGATYFFKSKYHRDLYPYIPDERAQVIGNGIVKEQFS